MGCTTAPWPIPVGWSYVYEDIHSIARDVGGWRLTIAEQEEDARWARWTWWVGPKGSTSGVVRGEADDMLSAIWCAFDALARQLEEPTERTDHAHPGMRSALAALEKAGSMYDYDGSPDGEILHHIGQAMTDLAWMLRTLKDPQADALLDVARAFEERHR